MAREIANIRLAMWGDRDWRGLNLHEQHLYMYLLSAPSLTYAGVADWRPGRIAALTAGLTADDVVVAARGLQAKAFVYCDDDTEEIFVRSFVKHDGLLKHARIPVAMANDFAAIVSQPIQEFFVHELKRERERSPELKCWVNERVAELLGNPSRDLKGEPPPEPMGDAPVDRLVDARVDAHPEPHRDALHSMHTATTTATATTTSPAGEGVQGEIVQSEPLSEETPSSPPTGRRKPAKPIPEDWSPTTSHEAKAKELGLDVHAMADEFVNWALGKDERKADWSKAFHGWLTRQARWQRERGSRPQFPPKGQAKEDANIANLSAWVQSKQQAQDALPFPGGDPA